MSKISDDLLAMQMVSKLIAHTQKSSPGEESSKLNGFLDGLSKSGLISIGSAAETGDYYIRDGRAKKDVLVDPQGSEIFLKKGKFAKMVFSELARRKNGSFERLQLLKIIKIKT